MDAKKPGVLQHLRRKILTHPRRGKVGLAKSAIHTEHAMDHSMSTSVPNMRDMRQDYAQVFSRTQPKQYNLPSNSIPSTSLAEAGCQRGGGGQMVNLGSVREVMKRSGNSLSMPANYMDWASSKHSSSAAEDNAHYRLARGMEPEELSLPKVVTPPAEPPEGGSQSQMGNEAASASEHSQDLRSSFLLTVHLKEGHNLVVRDRCGETT